MHGANITYFQPFLKGYEAKYNTLASIFCLRRHLQRPPLTRLVGAGMAGGLRRSAKKYRNRNRNRTRRTSDAKNKIVSCLPIHNTTINTIHFTNFPFRVGVGFFLLSKREAKRAMQNRHDRLSSTENGREGGAIPYWRVEQPGHTTTVLSKVVQHYTRSEYRLSSDG